MGGTKQRYKTAPDRWRLRVDAGIHPVTGQRRRLTRVIVAPHTKRGERDLVDPALASLLADAALLRGDPTALDSMTVAQLAARFRDHRSRTVRHKTLTEYELALARALPYLGNLPVDRVRPVMIDDLYRQLAADGITSTGIVKVHRALKAMFFQAVRWQITIVNPALGATPPRTTAKRITPPTPEQFTAAMVLLDRIDVDLGAFARIAAWTGARRGELCALRWDHVDLKVGALLIDSSVALTAARQWSVGPTKTRREQTLALGPKAVDVLTAHRGRTEAAGDALGVSPGLWVFPTNRALLDDLPRPNAWGLRWRRNRTAIGLGDVRLHDLRHYAATQLYGGGFDPITVQYRLTHSTPTTGLKSYAAHIPAKDMDAAVYLENL